MSRIEDLTDVTLAIEMMKMVKMTVSIHLIFVEHFYLEESKKFRTASKI